MRKVNLAIIGMGYWGPNLLRNFLEIKNCNVVAACDIEPQKLNIIKKRYPFIKLTENFEDVVNAEDIDAIAIATPANSHYDIASRALKKGKHVLVEKPICTNMADAKNLIKISSDNAATLMVDHTFLYSASVRKARELISSGQIGNLYYFDSVRINLGLFRSDVSVIWDLASHDIAIATYLIGEKPDTVSVLGRDFSNNGVPCLAYIWMGFSNDVIGHIHVSWLSPVKVRRITIAGDKEMIIYDDVEPTEKIKVYDACAQVDYSGETPFQPTYRSGDILIPKLDQREPLLVEAEHFIDCILNQKRPLTDGEFGLGVVKVLQACDVSLKNGGVQVKVGNIC